MTEVWFKEIEESKNGAVSPYRMIKDNKEFFYDEDDFFEFLSVNEIVLYRLYQEKITTLIIRLMKIEEIKLNTDTGNTQVSISFLH